MSETFRLAGADEVPAIARLVGHSFVGRTQEALEELVASGPYGGLEVLWVGEADGRLTSACHLLRFRQWVAGRRLRMMGLAVVAVSPAHRRRGVAARLVTSGLRHARERGDLVSALYPFRVAFYQGLGYGLAGEAHQYMLAPAQFPAAPERDRAALVEDDADHAAVRTVYERWAAGQTGQLERHAGHWSRVWSGEKAGVLYRNAAGEPEGYAVVRYRSDLAPQERFLEVEEQAWLSAEARRGLHGWLATLGDQWQTIGYRAHPDEAFAERIREPRLPLGDAPGWGLWFPSATLLRGPMFRLLDLERAWAERPVASGTAAVDLVVEDDQIPENAGGWRLVLEDGAARVERSAGGGVDCTLRLPVATLSRIFVGALSASVAVEAGLAEADRPERLGPLDTALRLPRPWTFDRF